MNFLQMLKSELTAVTNFHDRYVTFSVFSLCPTKCNFLYFSIIPCESVLKCKNVIIWFFIKCDETDEIISFLHTTTLIIGLSSPLLNLKFRKAYYIEIDQCSNQPCCVRSLGLVFLVLPVCLPRMIKTETVYYFVRSLY